MTRVRLPTTLLVAVVTAAMFSACSHAPVLNEQQAAEQSVAAVAAAKAALDKASDEWSKAVAAKDLDQCVSFYVDDAVLFAPNAPAAVGKDAIRAVWKQLLAAPSVQLTFPSTKMVVARSRPSGPMQEANRPPRMAASCSSGRSRRTAPGKFSRIRMPT